MKLLLLTTFLLFTFLFPALAQTSNSSSITHEAVDKGVGLGAVIAVVASWSRNRSVAWAILHGILSWLYVIHFVLTRGTGDE